MKNTKWMLPVMLMLVSGLMSAQSLTQQSVVSQVPFNFMVGDKMIPAGECSIKAADTNGRVLAVRNYDAKISAMVSSHPGSSSAGNSTVLVFKSYGDRYFLSSIRIEGSDRTYTLPATRAEAELRAQNVTVSQTTLLASLR